MYTSPEWLSYETVDLAQEIGARTRHANKVIRIVDEAVFGRISCSGSREYFFRQTKLLNLVRVISKTLEHKESPFVLNLM